LCTSLFTQGGENNTVNQASHHPKEERITLLTGPPHHLKEERITLLTMPPTILGRRIYTVNHASHPP